MDYISFSVSLNGKFLFRTEPVQLNAGAIGAELIVRFPKSEGFTVRRMTQSAEIVSVEVSV